MNFQELIKKKMTYLDYERGALMAREAIIDLLLKINDENYNAHGEHINQSWTVEELILMIKGHSNE